jgi:invasion protein IalB
MRWVLVPLLLGLLQTAPAAWAQSLGNWAIECRPDRPLKNDNCSLAHHSTREDDIAVVMFSYVDRELSLLISGDRVFTQAEIDIDEDLVFFTFLCGEGYCFFSGSVAEKLAQHFARGRSAVIEIATSSFGVDLKQRVDLSGFGSAFAEFQTGRGN